ncbi:hypothetical protein [Pseudogulbenkiania ferrooxidans]|uniref:hypothetical protein n=1 Tax=Pseudogulbenkiania ferrooxidans TaxID=549169 RepID=UPI0012376FB0|nr:hypothetical protein [Pseudogulbenkiania ferrooxidans]
MKVKLIKWLLLYVIERSVTSPSDAENATHTSVSQKIQVLESWIVRNLAVRSINSVSQVFAGMLFY